MGETVKPPKQPTPSYNRSYPPGVTLHVSTSIVFSPRVLVESRAVVELGDVRAMVTDYDPELGEITAEVLD